MSLRSLGAVSGAMALIALAQPARAADAPATTSTVLSQDVHRAPQPDASYGHLPLSLYPTLSWALFQLVPSPELAFGRHRKIGPTGNVESDASPSFGLRWQLTPVLWSWGTHPRQSRWRYFIVDPMARQSGSIELSTSFEYIGGHVDRFLVRPGLRAYFPLAHKGEYLSTSIGTSVYEYGGAFRVAYDVGAYVLAGMLGVQLTVAPAHAPLAAITTFRVRYF